ncbi:hypothetical protein MKW92_016184 [Papaver armeniacum]|nr:hypothetical protein MKW92_016184 [Papaver armeniacum]
MELSLPFHGQPLRGVETRKLLLFFVVITCSAFFAVQIFFTPYGNVFRILILANNASARDSSSPDNSTPCYDSTMATPSDDGTETSDCAKNMSQKSITTMLAEMIPPSNRLKKTWMQMIPKSTTSISAMSRLLLKNLAASSHSTTPKSKWSSEQYQEMLAVKSEIENAPIIKNDNDLYAPIYRNLSTFKRSYELMEQMLKVYIYKEGEKPFFHDPKLWGVYASEGWFMKQMEEHERFIVQDPTKAHLFYLPFSSERIRYSSLYDHKIRDKSNFIKLLSDYLDIIKDKYPFWNRTGGADHFFTACHDWAPIMTRPFMNGCIRAFCNSDVNEDFVLGKDVALAETLVLSEHDLLKDIGGEPPSKRQTLAFFAGNIHGYLRPILLAFWENKDPDMQIYGKMNKTVTAQMSYIQRMKTSKYCISAKGYEVASPRVVEAIFFECVPVIISDNYVLPFFEVLDWESFAVIVAEKDIPNLKKILLSIPEEKYIEMHKRVKMVQQHFLWHNKPVKYDIFHMTLHSIWYNRVFQV